MHRFTPLLALVTTLSPAFGAASVLDLLGTWNVAAMDYTMGGETEGAVFVAGSFDPTGAQQVGFNGGAAKSPEDYTLWLNNGITSTSTAQMNIQSGSVISRLDVDDTRFQIQHSGDGAALMEGESAWSDALAEVGLNSAAEALDTYAAAAAYWAGLTANSFATQTENSVQFNATPEEIQGSQVAIFEVNADNFIDSIGEFNAALNGAEAVLINVSGTGDYSLTGNFIGDFVGNESRIIFNFHEASSVSFGSPVRGAIFAPDSDVIQSGGNVDGAVVAQSFSQSGGEVHSHIFERSFPVPAVIPEPSTAALTGLASLLLLYRRR